MLVREGIPGDVAVLIRSDILYQMWEVSEGKDVRSVIRRSFLVSRLLLEMEQREQQPAAGAASWSGRVYWLLEGFRTETR